MKLTIPNELFNAVEEPPSSVTSVRVTDYLSTVTYRLPNCSDLTVEREFWNTVCDFADRCGSLREKQSGTLTANKKLTVTAPAYGDFQRFVGAGVGGVKASITGLSVDDSGSYPALVFSSASSGDSASVVFSVVPDVNAMHDKTPVTSGGTTTYPNDKWIVPSWFVERYSRLLLAGTMFRLLSMSGRPWSDFNSARTNALVYNREINRITHGLITSGMRRQALMGAETPFVGNAQQAATTTTTTQQG